jgi:hypothetical protein
VYCMHLRLSHSLSVLVVAMVSEAAYSAFLEVALRITYD